MPRNAHFSQSVRSEQTLYEDLVIESLKIFGQDVYYIPRTLVSRDNILGEDPASLFDDAYLMEAYIENQDGFEGAGDLYQKFGLEIRDEANFIISRREWQKLIGFYEENNKKPSEGDLLFLPLSNSFFEITFVEHEQPFYQLSNLPVFKLTCSLFEYSDEQIHTNIESIDKISGIEAYQTKMDLTVVDGAHFYSGETISQILVPQDGDTPAIIVSGEILSIDVLSAFKATINVINIGVTGSDGEQREFIESATVGVVGSDSGSTCHISKIYTVSDEESFPNDNSAQNTAFEIEADGFLDFTESNPFGDPSEIY